MENNYTEVLRVLIHKYRLEQKAIANKAGINENTLVKILNGKSSPTVRTLEAVVDACESFRMGFKFEYHRQLLGERLDLNQLVFSLSSAELSTLLICAGQRINKFQLVDLAA